MASEVAVPWDIAYFIEFLNDRIQKSGDRSQNAEFLTALVAALNERTELSALDQFPEWREQPPVPLDAPWPD